MPASLSNRAVGRFVFLIWVLVASALFAALFQLRIRLSGSNAEIIVWLGFSFLGLLWGQAVEGRILDAGLPRSYRWPYILILPFGCVLLLALKVLDGPEALALFILAQVPTVFIKSRASSPTLP
jgi:hypothetical protein